MDNELNTIEETTPVQEVVKAPKKKVVQVNDFYQQSERVS